MMNVYFTVDTESSIGGAWQHPERRPVKADRHIFCRINGRDHGIGLITDILGQQGFRATYFVETLMTLVNGEEDTRAVFDYLLEHNQDVQLHIHPVYRFYAEVLKAQIADEPHSMPEATTDFIGAYEEQRQMELLDQALVLFRRFACRSPIAFRAGCFAASRETLRCLRKLGMLLDSSFNPCYPAWSFAGQELESNRVCNIEGIWEIPVTVSRTPLPEGNGLKHADPCALSLGELRTMLEAGVASGQRHFVIVFHSFSAVKPRDCTYNEMRPDRIVIRRLEKLTEYLRKHSDLYRVCTFGELAEEIASVVDTPGSMATLKVLPAALRKSVQGLNRNYWL
jgi:hypothetical protein